MDNLGKGGEAVGGAGRIGNNRFRGFVFFVVNSHDIGGGVIFGGGGEDYLFGTSFDVLFAGFFGEEGAGGFADGVDVGITPFDIGGTFGVEETDFLAIDAETSVNFFNFMVKTSVG